MKKIIPDDNARGRLFYAFLELIEKSRMTKSRSVSLSKKRTLTARPFIAITAIFLIIMTESAPADFIMRSAPPKNALKGKARRTGLKHFRKY